MLLSACVLAACAAHVSSFYLPGVAPKEYGIGENCTIKVNSIKSTKTAIPYDYYTLMFCRPEQDKRGKVKSDPENLGEILWGDRIQASRYRARMQVEVGCRKVCRTVAKDDARNKDGSLRNLKKLKSRIDDEYRGHLILDNLPVSEVFIWERSKEALYYRRGYPLGVPGNATNPTLVHNHLAFTIKWHKPAGVADGFRIVGFNVYPYSVDNNIIETECKEGTDWEPWKYPPQQVIVKKNKKPGAKPDPMASKPETKSVSWSYSVHWEEDPDVAWTSRWDHYLHSADSADAKIHWFSIINSLLVVLFLSAMTATIMLRSLHKDFNRYNNPENEYEQQEETGWKMVHGDVFRDPPYPTLLAVYIGSGTQILCMSCVTITFACLGFLSPANRGALMTAMLVLFVLMGSVCGFVTSRLAQMFLQAGYRPIIMAGTFVPGKVFGVFFLVNIILWAKQAANAVPFVTLFGLIGLWFCVSVPLVMLGALFGFKRGKIAHPLPATNVARSIPPQPWFLRAPVVIPLAGLVPFMAVFIEVSFILSSLWLNKFYYVFGFFAIVFCILVVTCAETAIVGTYFQLCFEDYTWWWRAFLSTGSCGGIMFLYCLYYYFSTLQLISFWSGVLYYGYMAVASYLFGILTGTVGWIAAFFFVRKIYSELKVD